MTKRKRVPSDAEPESNAPERKVKLWPSAQELKWTPQHPVVVSRAEYDSMFEVIQQRKQSVDYQLHQFDAIPWQIHLAAWEPATGTRHVLLETIGFDNHAAGSPDKDFRSGTSNWQKVETDPEAEGFDGFLLMMMNAYRLIMEDWLKEAPEPQNLFWHKIFAPADISVLARFVSAYEYSAGDRDFVVCGPVLPAEWKDLQDSSLLLNKLQGMISEEWVRASMTALEIAKELDSSLVKKRKACKHSKAKINNLRSLEAEASKQMQLAMEGKDLRPFMADLLPDSLAGKPFFLENFKSQEFIDHMKILRGETREEEPDFSG